MSTTSLLVIILSLPGAILAPAIHEYFKALLSFRQRDPNPKLQGRLRLNPFRHLEPVGFFLMLCYGYGWGKPVNTNAMYYRDRRRGTMITYGAPSLINILFAFAAGSVLAVAKILAVDLGSPFMSVQMAYSIARISDPITWIPLASSILYQMVYHFARLNLSLALFNIIPVYPLDGAKILALYMTPGNALMLSSNEKRFQAILLILMVFGIVNGIFDQIIMFLLAFAR
jgi:Zn-dependent protease